MKDRFHRLFLGWDRPWLHQLVDYLLNDSSTNLISSALMDPAGHSSRGDLSNTVLILPGRRAGRRLLELLAIKAGKESLALIPPHIVTLREAVSLLLGRDQKMFPEAGALTCHLAWREAIKKLSTHARASIQEFPGRLSSSEIEAASHRIAALAEKTAHDLGGAGLDFIDIAKRIGQLRPDFADREEARWQALAEAQKNYRNLLSSWKLIDPTDALRERITHGVMKKSTHVVACALVDYGPLFDAFFKKITPTILIAAPEIHSTGFSEQGKLVSSYWHQHPVSVEDNSIISCERSNDQAEEAARKIIFYQEYAPDIALSNLLSIASPDYEALPALREKLATANIPTRWAGGRTFRGGRFFQLLQATADFIDRPAHQSPSLKAVAVLLRHPDIGSHFSNTEQLIRLLDEFERDHLPQFLEQERLTLFKKNQMLATILPRLEELIGISSTCEPLGELLEELRSFLLRTIGKKILRNSNPEEHYFLGCLEKWLELLEELEQLSKNDVIKLRGSELITMMLEFLSSKEIPEREEPDAIELLGWLELAADDAPVAIITSFHEGALPRSQPDDPLLNEGLRKALGLATASDLLARDHYLLHTIIEPRKNNGDITIMAPRYNGRGEPVRPSRLLLLGCDEKKLPERILALSQRKQNMLQGKKSTASDVHHSLFQAHPIGTEIIEQLPATALRTYLQSPRLFYLKHVLKLYEVEESPLEMNAAHFGTLIHAVLAAFGSEEEIATKTDPKKINAWLQKKLTAITQHQFGKYPQFPIWSQIDEISRSLSGFATSQAAHCEAGWKIIASENSQQKLSPRLEERFLLTDGRSLLLHGRIDRVDWHEEKKQWRIIDYKTSSRRDWESRTPDKEHFQKRGSTFIWHDLQLPLYLKLVCHLDIVKNSGHPLPTINNTELCYFQLPLDPERAAVSEPFDNNMIEAAWEEAERVIGKILNREFEEIGNVDLEQSPTFAALCGITSI